MIEIFAQRGGALDRGVTIAALPAVLAEPGAAVWVNLAEPTPEEAERVLGHVFGFHPLAIEDTLEKRQQPKIEEFDGYAYMICHGVRAGSGPEPFVPVELDLFLGSNFVVSSHDERSRSIEETRAAVERGLLGRGPAAVLHAILDAQTDRFDPVLDGIGQRIETLEREVFAKAQQETLEDILDLKRSLLRLRRGIERQKQVILRLSRRDTALRPDEAVLFRDVHDRLTRVAEVAEQHREMLGGLLEMHLAVSSQRLGEVLKVLTIFSTIMLPLTLIAGVFGMNFRYMPELHWRWGYAYALALMAATTLVLLGYFRRQGWIGPIRAPRRRRPRAPREHAPGPPSAG